jgi:serine protease Do
MFMTVQSMTARARPITAWRPRDALLASFLGLALATLPVSPAARAQEFAQRSGFADVVEKVKPAVIGIRAKVEQETGDEQLPPDMPNPFRQFGTPKDTTEPPKRPRIGLSQGSGFFISADGYAVTANHVIARGRGIEITTDDGKTYPAKLVGADPVTDLALLKVEGGGEFPFVRLSERAPRIGEWVVVVGNPFGLGGTVTAGIVSARTRQIKLASHHNDFIQIDAPVNKGNSGGPAFDVDGNVIGVNSAIFSPTGGSIGIGFAIPAATVSTIVAKLRDKGTVTRGWLGVQIQAVTPEIAQAIGLTKPQGALVAAAEPNSPATKAGLMSGDVITAVGGQPVKDDRDLAKRVSDMAPGESIDVSIFRKGAETIVKVTLGQLPMRRSEAPAASERHEVPVTAADPAKLGLTLAPAANLGPGGEGVMIMEVDPDGVAADRGLEVGDVILEVGGQVAKTPADVHKALSDARRQGRHVALMRVKSGDETKYVAVPTG